MIINPDWVEKITAGKEIETEIDLDNLDGQKIPEKLVETLKKFPGWFKIKEQVTA